MITTVTINPCVDKTYFVDNFEIGKTNRTNRVMYNAGSKGINVSRVLKQLGDDTTCLGFVGGMHGDVLLQELKSEAINEDLIRVENGTRLNVKILDTQKHVVTEINEAGEDVTAAEINMFMSKFEEYAKKSKAIAISGSILPTMEKSIYHQLIKIAEKYDTKVWLDTYGQQLKEGIKAKPFCIKPNKTEFEELIGHTVDEDEDIVAEAKKIISQGVEYVVVTLGNEGTIGVSKTESFKIIPQYVEVVSTVGAGDSFFAGMLSAYNKGLPFKKQLVFATSCANAKVTKEGNNVPSIIELMGYLDGCIVIDLAEGVAK